MDGYGDDEICSAGRGNLLIPWPNRIRNGEYSFEGEKQQLPLTEPAKRNAIHGLTRWVPWMPSRHDPDRVELHYRLYPQSGYPHALDLRVKYEMHNDGFTVTHHAVNIGTTSAPYGHGAHPYLKLGTGVIDECLLQFEAATQYVTDDQQIPTGRKEVRGSAFDFHDARRIGTTSMDTGFTELGRDADGKSWIHLISADEQTKVSLWLDAKHNYLMLFTGDPLGDRARHGLGVEPMTCAPDAFNNGDGLIVLAPGETFEASWGVIYSR